MAAPDQYSSLVAARNTELQTHWTRYNVQVVLNGGLLVTVFASQTGSRIGVVPIWAVSSGGIMLAACWLGMVIQGKAWIHRYDEQLCLFEKQLGPERVYPLFNELRRTTPALNPWGNITALALTVPILSGLAWLALWLWS